MKKTTFIVFSLLLFSIQLYSQKVHSPAEIYKMMIDSKIRYGVSDLKDVIECKDYSTNLNSNFYYQVFKDNKILVNSYPTNNSYYKRAEDVFLSNPDSALYLYGLAYYADTSYYIALTNLGQMYERKGNVKKAMEYYKQAISKNHIDYMAHWFLADGYFATGDLPKAIDEITVAFILNRNNPRLKSAFERIYKQAKIKFEDWYFNPQIRLTKTPDQSVKLELGKHWMGYGMTKAFWEFEPGYQQSMGVDSGRISILEYRECLLCQYIGQQGNKVQFKKLPELKALNKAIEHKLLDEYILFELILPEHPDVAYRLPKQTIESIKNYIQKVRHN